MDLTIVLLALGLGVVAFAVAAGVYGFVTYNPGAAQVEKNLRHRAAVRASRASR